MNSETVSNLDKYYIIPQNIFYRIQTPKEYWYGVYLINIFFNSSKDWIPSEEFPCIRTSWVFIQLTNNSTVTKQSSKILSTFLKCQIFSPCMFVCLRLTSLFPWSRGLDGRLPWRSYNDHGPRFLVFWRSRHHKFEVGFSRALCQEREFCPH